MWLPGVPISASGAKQPVDISVKWKEIIGKQDRTNTHIKERKRRDKNAITMLLEKSGVIKFIYMYKVLILEKYTINSYSLKIHFFLK